MSVSSVRNEKHLRKTEFQMISERILIFQPTATCLRNFPNPGLVGIKAIFSADKPPVFLLIVPITKAIGNAQGANSRWSTSYITCEVQWDSSDVTLNG